MLLAALAGALLAALALAVWWGAEVAVDDTVFAGGARDGAGTSAAGDTRKGDPRETKERENDGGGRIEADIVLPVPVPKPGEFLVRVLDDESGAPVAGADVCADDPAYRFDRSTPEQQQLARRLVGEFARAFHFGQRTVSDANGYAVLRGESYMQVHATLGERYGSAYLQDASDGELVEVRLAANPSILVQVVDAAGNPLEGVPVHLAFESVEPGAAVGTAHSDLKGYTDGDGRLRIGELGFLDSPEVYRNLRVHVGAYGLGHVSAPTMLDAPGGEPVVLQLAAWGSLRLVFKDANGKPLAPGAADGDTLVLLAEGENLPESDSEVQMRALVVGGVAEFAYVGLGRALEANFWGRNVRVEQSLAGPIAHREVRTVDLVTASEESAHASGQLLADAALLAQVEWVVVRCAADDDHAGWFRVEPDGRFRWVFDASDLDASGKVRFLLTGRSEVLATTDVLVVPPAMKQVELGDVPVLTLEPLARGRLVVQEGQLPRARLTVETPNTGNTVSVGSVGEWNQNSDHRVTLAEDGSFEVHAVRGEKSQRRRLRVWSREFEPVAPVEFRPGDDNLRIELTKSARLEVKVLLDPGLETVAGISVEATGGSAEVGRQPEDNGPLRYLRGIPHSAPSDEAVVSVERELEFRNGVHSASLRGFRTGTVTVRVLLGERELGRVEHVAVTAGGSKDPRIDPMDLRGKVHALRVRVLDAAGNVADVHGTMSLRVPPAQQWEESNWLEHGVFRTLVPSTQAEFGLFSHELRPIHWAGPVGTVDLRLEPPFPVEFVLEGVDDPKLCEGLWLASNLPATPPRFLQLGLDESYWMHDDMMEVLQGLRAKGMFLVEVPHVVRLLEAGDGYNAGESLHEWQVDVRATQPRVALKVPPEVVEKLKAARKPR